MNICLMTPTFLPKLGGVEIVVHSLAERLKRLSHNPTVITQWPRRGKGTPHDNDLSYPVVRYRRPWSFRFSVGMHSIRRVLKNTHRRTPFDLIHCHLVYPVAHIAADFAKQCNIPLMITAHGSDVRADCRYRNRAVIWNRIVAALNSAQLVTTISKEMQQILANILHDRTNLVVIPNGIDPDELTAPASVESTWPVQQNGQYVLYLGGLTKKKGVDLLLGAMKTMHTQHRRPTTLIVAGDGPQREKLEKFARENDLSSSVRFVGPVTGNFKRYLLQNCQCVVMPSRTEAMGIVALEAFACGKPVIASAVGGLKEIVKDNVTGKLIPPENENALADAISQLTSNHAFPTEVIRAQAQKYTWDNITERYVQAYQRLLADR